MDKAKRKVMPVPDSARVAIQALMSDARQAQERLNMYVQGCKEGMGLEGDYNLNTSTWEFEPMSKEKG